MPKLPWEHTKSIRVVWHLFLFRANISYIWSYGSHWDPFCRKVKHRLRWIQKSRQNEQGTIRSPLGWLALFFISWLDYVPAEFTAPVGSRYGAKCNTKSDWFEMHPKISLEFGTNFYSVPIFRTCGVYSSRWNPLCRKVNTELGRLKTRAKMSKGAYDAHSGCLSLIFIWCQYFVRMEFIMPVGTNFGGIFNTGSDGFEMNPEMS